MGLHPKNLNLVTLSLYETFNIANTCILTVLYRRRGKIRWAKHSQFQPYEVFHGNTFTVHWPPVFIT